MYPLSDNVSLGQLIGHLESMDPTRVVPEGFGNPHSYRGYYDQLAFEPVGETTVGDMLEAARSALGTVYEGYKGGEYVMDESTDCWLAQYGCIGVPIVLCEPGCYKLPR